MNPDTDPFIVAVGYKTSYSALWTALGAIVVVAGVVATVLTGSGANLGVTVAGAAVLAFGFRSFSRPYCAFDYTSDTLYLVALFGGRHRVYGAPTGESIRSDGRRLTRVSPTGETRHVNTGPADPEDLAFVTAMIERSHRTRTPAP